MAEAKERKREKLPEKFTMTGVEGEWYDSQGRLLDNKTGKPVEGAKRLPRVRRGARK